MELRHLEYFVAVVDHGGVSRAAEALLVAQPTISQGLRTLERELKVTLFVRTGRNLTPSPAGLALLPDARRALGSVLTITDRAREIRDAKTGVVTITTMPELSSDALVSWAATFIEAHPEIQYVVSEAQSLSGLLAAVERGESELGFSSFPQDVPRPANSEVLATQRLLLVAPPGSDVLKGVARPDGVVPLDALPRIPIAVSHLANRENDTVAKVFGACGASFAPQAVVPNRSTQLAFVLSGNMFTFLPLRMAVTAYERGAQIYDTDPLIEVPFGFVYRSTGVSPAARQLIDSCRTRLREWNDAAAAGRAEHGTYAAYIRSLVQR